MSGGRTKKAFDRRDRGEEPQRTRRKRLPANSMQTQSYENLLDPAITAPRFRMDITEMIPSEITQ
jgi:hypothetical protein